MNKLLKKVKNNNDGFTLVELIVVIAIIGILAGLLMPKFGGFINKAKSVEVTTAAKQIYTAYRTAELELTGTEKVTSADIATYVDLGEFNLEAKDISVTPDDTDKIISFTMEVDKKDYEAAINSKGKIKVTVPSETQTKPTT